VPDAHNRLIEELTSNEEQLGPSLRYQHDQHVSLSLLYCRSVHLLTGFNNFKAFLIEIRHLYSHFVSPFAVLINLYNFNHTHACACMHMQGTI
jgi:hypothetical protein